MKSMMKSCELCRVLMTEVVSELASLKVAWEHKLSEVSASLEEVMELREAHTEFSKLQQQQNELREELEVLSRYSMLLVPVFHAQSARITTKAGLTKSCICRMLKMRETETQTLQAQLEQVRLHFTF